MLVFCFTFRNGTAVVWNETGIRDQDLSKFLILLVDK